MKRHSDLARMAWPGAIIYTLILLVPFVHPQFSVAKPGAVEWLVLTSVIGTLLRVGLMLLYPKLPASVDSVWYVLLISIRAVTAAAAAVLPIALGIDSPAFYLGYMTVGMLITSLYESATRYPRAYRLLTLILAIPLPIYLLAVHSALSLALLLATFCFVGLVQYQRMNLEKAHQRLEESNRFLRQLIDSIPVSLSIVSHDLRYKTVNTPLLQMLQVEESDILGRRVGFMKGSQDPFVEFLDEFIRSGRDSWVLQKQLVVAGVPKWHMMYFQKFDWQRGSDYIVASVDIEDRMNQERQLREAAEEIERQRLKLFEQSKMSALGEMAAGIAHEINNPLTIITGKVRILRERRLSNMTDEQMDSHLDRIEAMVGRISRIITTMRNLTRNTDTTGMTRASAGDLVRECLVLSEERRKSYGITVETNVPEELPLRCRPTEIQQVLINLLNNSFQAIKELPERWIRIEARENDGTIIISVTDSGPGIPTEVAEKIMMPFFTTKVDEGTGLGLPISRSIMHSHRGSLELRRDCANTCFELTLPFAGD